MSTTKMIGWIAFIFFTLVGVNYIYNAAGKFLSDGGFAYAFAQDAQPVSYARLPYIDVNFFASNGTGRNYITQGYGRTADAYLYIDGFHPGIDLAANFGTPIYSPTAGTVLATINQDAYCPHIAYGKYVAIDDTTNHLILMFSHLGTFNVSPGQTITKGTYLGVVGPTGLETGPHLLFSIYKEQGFVISPAHGCGPYPQGETVDPMNYLGSTYK